MAVTVADLGVALRIIGDTSETIQDGQSDILTRLLGVGEAFTELLAPDAPEVVRDESIVRFAAYLFDVPPGSSRRDVYSNAWVNSGAGALLSRWAPQAASATATTPSGGTGGLNDAQVRAIVNEILATHAGLPNIHHTPTPAADLSGLATRIYVDGEVSDLESEDATLGARITTVDSDLRALMQGRLLIDPPDDPAMAGYVNALNAQGNAYELVEQSGAASGGVTLPAPVQVGGALDLSPGRSGNFSNYVDYTLNAPINPQGGYVFQMRFPGAPAGQYASVSPILGSELLALLPTTIAAGTLSANNDPNRITLVFGRTEDGGARNLHILRVNNTTLRLAQSHYDVLCCKYQALGGLKGDAGDAGDDGNIDTGSGVPADADADAGRNQWYLRRDSNSAISQWYHSAEGATTWTLVKDDYQIARERIDAQVEAYARLGTDKYLQVRAWDSEDAADPRTILHHRGGLWFNPAPIATIAAGVQPGGSERQYRLVATGRDNVEVAFNGTTFHNYKAGEVVLWRAQAGADFKPAIVQRDFYGTGAQLRASQNELLHVIEPGTPQGGGFPTTRTQVLSATISTTNTPQTLSEALQANTPYELVLNGATRHIFLTGTSGAYRVIYNAPDEVGNNQFESIYLWLQMSVGSTAVTQFQLQQASGQSASLVLNKLT